MAIFTLYENIFSLIIPCHFKHSLNSKPSEHIPKPGAIFFALFPLFPDRLVLASPRITGPQLEPVLHFRCPHARLHPGRPVQPGTARR